MENDITGLLIAILSVGGTGGAVALVAAVRSWQKGRVEDEGTLIERLDKSEKYQRDRAKVAEDERDKELQKRITWMNQAITYRQQLREANVVPIDMPGYPWPEGGGRNGG